jgi:hypothetical protein
MPGGGVSGNQYHCHGCPGEPCHTRSHHLQTISLAFVRSCLGWVERAVDTALRTVDHTLRNKTTSFRKHDLAFSNTSLSMNPLKVVDSGSSECRIIAGCVGNHRVRIGRCLGSVVGLVCCSLGSSLMAFKLFPFGYGSEER